MGVRYNALVNSIEVELNTEHLQVCKAYEVTDRQKWYVIYFGNYLLSWPSMQEALSEFIKWIKLGANIKILYNNEYREVFRSPSTVIIDPINNILSVY